MQTDRPRNCSTLTTAMTHTETLQRKGEKLFLLYFLLIQLFNFTEQLLIAFGWLDDLSGHGVTCSHRAGAAEDVEVCCPGPVTRLTKPSAEEDAGSRFQFLRNSGQQQQSQSPVRSTGPAAPGVLSDYKGLCRAGPGAMQISLQGRTRCPSCDKRQGWPRLQEAALLKITQLPEADHIQLIVRNKKGWSFMPRVRRP